MKRRETLLVIFLLLVSSCATPKHTYQESTESLVDVGNYLIKSPPGQDWKMEVEKDKGFVRFTRDKASMFFTIIIVRELTIDKMNLHTATEIADNFRSNLQQVLKEKEAAEKYEVKSVEKEVITLKEKTYYALFYKKWLGGFWGKGTEYGSIFLYIPSNYERNHKYYGFLLMEIYPRGMMTGPAIERNRNVNIIHEIMESFQTK